MLRDLPIRSDELPPMRSAPEAGGPRETQSSVGEPAGDAPSPPSQSDHHSPQSRRSTKPTQRTGAVNGSDLAPDAASIERSEIHTGACVSRLMLRERLDTSESSLLKRRLIRAIPRLRAWILGANARDHGFAADRASDGWCAASSDPTGGSLVGSPRMRSPGSGNQGGLASQ